MSGLKVFANLMSQPSRAVVLFLKANNIPHELKTVELKKGSVLQKKISKFFILFISFQVSISSQNF